jgi:tetratricopeptide (TPR) repeat protein
MRASLAEWRRSRRDESLLLRDGKRTEAARWLAERTNDLNAGEHEYINASIDLQEREHIKTAERVFALLTPQEQEAARRVLKGLVRVADSPTDGDYTRSTLSIETLTELDRRVLKTFADAGLVTFESNKDSLEKEAHLADESLLKRWTRLSDWISEDRAFILWRQELRLMIEAWEDKEHNEDGLLHDIALAQAENWAKERNQDLTPKEYVYIAESRATQASIEKQYNRLSSEQQTATRRALTRMVRLDPSQDSSKDSPGSVRMDELDPSSKTAVLWLSDAGIVTLTVDTITGFDIAYLSDGSLLKRWQRLKDWIKEGREFLLWRQQLRIYIVAWENSSKDKNALLPDASLIAGKRWLKSREKDLNEREKDYLIESIRQYTRRRIMAAAVVLFVLVVLALLINRPSRKSPPPTPGIDALVVELNSQGRLALAFGDLQEAIEKYTQAVSIDPKFPESYINRGDAYLKTQEYDGAIADFSRAIELNPASAAAFKGRALGLFNKQNDKDAIADFTVAIDLNPQDSESYYSRGLAYASRKDYTPAIADFRKAIEVKADFGEAYLDLAYANLKKGDKSEAIANFQKASSTATDPAIRDAAQDELRRLGKAPNIAKVYVYYKEIKDKPVIDDLVARLKRRGFITVGPNLASDSTSGDVRYFDNEDQPIAAYVEKIVEYSLKLSAITLNVKTVSFVGQATKDEPHTIELRLPPLPVAPEFLDK